LQHVPPIITLIYGACTLVIKMDTVLCKRFFDKTIGGENTCCSKTACIHTHTHAHTHTRMITYVLLCYKK